MAAADITGPALKRKKTERKREMARARQRRKRAQKKAAHQPDSHATVQFEPVTPLMHVVGSVRKPNSHAGFLRVATPCTPA
jgi:hypothetical protein